MSDLNPVIVNGIGSPRAWLFTNSGEPLSDFDGQIVAKFLTKFSYTYNEEEDDECSMTFMFPTLRSFDLPYFQQDVVLHVEWGYIVTDGRIIKSPRRIIAIRDLEVNYKKDGIQLVLKCTDLISYLKGMKTQRINKYKEVKTGPSTGSAEGDLEARRQAEIEALFFDKVIGVSGGDINVSKVEGNKTTVINGKGQTKVGIKNPTTGIYRAAPPPKKEWTGGNAKRTKYDKDIENNALKNLGNTSYDRALEINLKYNNQIDKLSYDMGDEAGPKIADSTDNNIEIKARIFGQPIFKQYTYFGGSGELLSFKSNTDTRKTKENKTISSGVDPHKKSIIKVEVDTQDSKSLVAPVASKKAIQEQLQKAAPQEEGPSEDIMMSALRDSEAEFKEQYQQLKPDARTNRGYKEMITKYDPSNTYMGYMAKKTTTRVWSRQEVINTPRFQNWKNTLRSPDLKPFNGGRGGPGIKKVLTGYSIESIQRKYTGTAEVIGDPSLIKGKVYLFNNLGRLDRGKWYATSIEHKLEMDSGYICTMNLMQNPKPIGISSKTYSANPKFDRVTGDINIKQEIETSEGIIYSSKNEEKEYTIADIDKVEQENQYREEDIVSQMDNRLNFLKSSDDSFNLLVSDEEFLVEDYKFIQKPKPNSHRS